MVGLLCGVICVGNGFRFCVCFGAIWDFVFEMVLVSVHPVCLWVASAAINGVRLLRGLEVVFWG